MIQALRTIASKVECQVFRAWRGDDHFLWNTNAMLLYLTLIFAIRRIALSFVQHAVRFDNCNGWKDRVCHSCRSWSRRLQGRRLGMKRRTGICFNGSSQIGFLPVSIRWRTPIVHFGSIIWVGYTMAAQSKWAKRVSRKLRCVEISGRIISRVTDPSEL